MSIPGSCPPAPPWALPDGWSWAHQAASPTRAAAWWALHPDGCVRPDDVYPDTLISYGYPRVDASAQPRATMPSFAVPVTTDPFAAPSSVFLAVALANGHDIVVRGIKERPE